MKARRCPPPTCGIEIDDTDPAWRAFSARHLDNPIPFALADHHTIDEMGFVRDARGPALRSTALATCAACGNPFVAGIGDQMCLACDEQTGGGAS